MKKNFETVTTEFQFTRLEHERIALEKQGEYAKRKMIESLVVYMLEHIDELPIETETIITEYGPRIRMRLNLIDDFYYRDLVESNKVLNNRLVTWIEGDKV